MGAEHQHNSWAKLFFPQKCQQMEKLFPGTSQAGSRRTELLVGQPGFPLPPGLGGGRAVGSVPLGQWGVWDRPSLWLCLLREENK